MYSSGVGEETYRVEWVALINRHLEVGLELIKRCDLREAVREIEKTTMRRKQMDTTE